MSCKDMLISGTKTMWLHFHIFTFILFHLTVGVFVVIVVVFNKVL